jgi:tartrate-resistant acid phosphatase type 5
MFRSDETASLWIAMILVLPLLGGCAGPPLDGAVVSGGARIEQLEQKRLHVLVIGDWGIGSPLQRDVAEAMANYADRHRRDDPVHFVISTGDNFYPGGVSSVDDRQWRTKFEQVYNETRLPMPFIAVLGNHDWRLNPTAQMVYTQRTGTRWQMDAFYFSRRIVDSDDEPLADLFFIDTNLYLRRGQRLPATTQTQWLEETLATSEAPWKLVVAHHALYSNGAHGGSSTTLNLRRLLSPILARHQVDAYISGHDHDLQRIELEGHPTLFLVSGAGGQVRPQKYNTYRPFFAAVGGFLAMRIDTEEMSGQFIDADGTVLDTWSVPRGASAGAADADDTGCSAAVSVRR